MTSFLFLLACLLLLPGDVEIAPDVVEFKNGRKLSGRVVYEDQEVLVLKVKTREKEYKQEDIAKVQATRRELPKALDEIASLPESDLVAHHALANSLTERNLLGEARLMYWKALSLEPGDDVAHEALGHRRRGKSWTLPHRGRWYRLADFKKLLGDWGSAWEFETTHFQVRTNQTLSNAVKSTLLLERTYRGFYDLLGKELQLRDLTKCVGAHIHADKSSFPDSIGSGRSYYSPGDRRILVNAVGSGAADSGPALLSLVHETCHALVHASSVDAGSGRGDVPGWLNEGLAIYMETSIYMKDGVLLFSPGTPDENHFSIHASAKKPIKLSRLLNMATGDFHGSSHTALKYAQSYTFVHFLLHAEEGLYRPGFFAFLAAAYEGKSSATQFKKSMGMKKDKLDKAWQAYANGDWGK